jgi:hypothetical protein
MIDQFTCAYNDLPCAMPDKQGISKRFLTYLNGIDSKLGARTLGPDQTISGKIQSHVTAATQQVKAVDEQKGYSKMANDVPVILSSCLMFQCRADVTRCHCLLVLPQGVVLALGTESL